jgi:hypothetical protein
MNKDKLESYESLIRASLVLVFVVALTVGTFGVIAISQILMRQTVPTPMLLNTDSVPETHNRRA